MRSVARPAETDLVEEPSVGELLGFEGETVFEGRQPIAHGSFYQARGSIIYHGEEYPISISERDTSIHIQVRDPSGHRIHESYYDMPEPEVYGEHIPQTDEEFQQVLEENLRDNVFN